MFVIKGFGTPAPISAPIKLVTDGYYRYVRNPMYVAIISVILCEVILYESISIIIWAIFGFLATNTFVSLYEEPHLFILFG